MKLSLVQIQLLKYNQIQPLALHASFACLQKTIDSEESFADDVESLLGSDLEREALNIEQCSLAEFEQSAKALATFDDSSVLNLALSLELDLKQAFTEYAPRLRWQVGQTLQLQPSHLLLTPLLNSAEKRALWQLMSQYSDSTN